MNSSPLSAAARRAFLRTFDLRVAGMPQEGIAASFTVEDDFFRLFDAEATLTGTVAADVRLYPQGDLLYLDCVLQGALRLRCDRTLVPFDHPLVARDTVRFAFGEKDSVLDEQAYEIKFDTLYLNVAQHIYDFINLALPERRLAPAQRGACDQEGIMYTATSQS